MVERIKNWLLLLGGLISAILYGMWRKEQSRRVGAEAESEHKEYEIKKQDLEHDYEVANDNANRLVDDYNRARSSTDKPGPAE